MSQPQDAAAGRRPRQKKRTASAASTSSSSSKTIPADASEWMSNVCGLDRDLCDDPSMWQSVLTAPQLKNVYNALREVDPISQKRAPLAARRQTKAALVEEVRSSFYMDAGCTVVDVAAMQALRLHAANHPFGSSTAGLGVPAFGNLAPPPPPPPPAAAAAAAFPHAPAAFTAPSFQPNQGTQYFAAASAHTAPNSATRFSGAQPKAAPAPSVGSNVASSSPAFGRRSPAPYAISQPFAAGPAPVPFGGQPYSGSGYALGATSAASPATAFPQPQSGGFGSPSPFSASASTTAAATAAAAAAPTSQPRRTMVARRGVASIKSPPRRPPHDAPRPVGHARGSQASYPSTSASGFGLSAPSPFQGATTGSGTSASLPFPAFPTQAQQQPMAPPQPTAPRTAASQNTTGNNNPVFVFGGQAPAASPFAAAAQAQAAPFAASSNPSRHHPTTAASYPPSQTSGSTRGYDGAAAPHRAPSVGRVAQGAHSTGAPPNAAATSNAPPNAAAPSNAPTASAAEATPENTPQNDEEARLLPETMAMGFRNPAEVLISIRKLMAANPGQQQLTAEMVMCDVVNAREEAEFARQMDQARLLSERDRRTDAEARRKANALAHEEQLLTACPTVWVESKDMFKGSWLLKSSCRESLLSHVSKRPSEVKRHLVEILKLEKKSRQWYGQELPSYYFDGVLAEKLRVIKDCRALETALQREAETLRDGLMLLSNQDGNAPLVFLEAKEEWKRRHGEDDDDDDDVILLETRRPTQASQRAETIETI